MSIYSTQFATNSTTFYNKKSCFFQFHGYSLTYAD